MDVDYFHVESDNIDLEIAPGEKRQWIGISGRNIPSFEIFVSPDWRTVRGEYYADQPSYRSGNRVEGVRLVFQKGRAIKVSAVSGENFVKKQLAIDKGADKLGEFSLTDKRFSKINCFMANTLYDENYGGRYGNCHIALGASYANTFAGDGKRLTPTRKRQLGFNESALHWDLVNTEKMAKDVQTHIRSYVNRILNMSTPDDAAVMVKLMRRILPALIEFLYGLEFRPSATVAGLGSGGAVAAPRRTRLHRAPLRR